MSTIDWATLDEANKADRHYNRWPEFYRLAVQAEEQARIDWQAALNAWIDCPDWQEGTKRQLYERITPVEAIWIDLASAKRTLYMHWQGLVYWATQDCDCNPCRVCRACAARAKLNDPAYEPSIKQLLQD